MTTDIEGSLRRVQAGDYLKTWLIDGTFRFLGVLQSDADLVTPLRVFIGLEILYRLRKVVLDKVEECAVVFFLHPRVMYDEGTIRDNRSGRLVEQGLITVRVC